MALFGKKGKDDAPVLGATVAPGADGDGGVAVAGVAVAEAPARKKAARAPKAPKNKTLKNGVAVGLNIGNKFIKAVEVTSKNGELVVTAMGAVPTPTESYTNGNVLSVSALSGAIKELWRGAGIKSKVAITSVAGTGALVVRVIEVPRMSDGELSDNMKVDADRYIPFPPSEVVMDFKALRELPTDPDAPNMEVLLAAAQREIIDLHVQVVQKAKLDPRAIDVEPIAAARALQLERRGDGNSNANSFIDYNEITAIVNLGATGTEISILRGDILVFTRVVPGGGNLITQAIAEGLGLPFADAERVKIDSADAQAPAGYSGGNGFGASANASDDFNFGGAEFGGDLDAAFDDISANPTAVASDDPFDLDFFNQGPKTEPGAGHAQKEGEPGEETPAFNFSGFNFDEPLAAQPEVPRVALPQVETQATSASTPAANSFDFGFDDAESASSTSAMPLGNAESEVAPVGNQTAKLEDMADLESDSFLPSLIEAPSAPEEADTNAGFSGADVSMPSAFDFDNFDLPAAAPDSSLTVSTPIESVSTPMIASSGGSPLGVTPSVPPSPGDTTPAIFGFEDSDLASKSTADKAPLEMGGEVETASPTAFNFAVSEPLSATRLSPEPIFPDPVVEEVPLSSVFETSGVLESPSAPPVDEFDLDAIFGSPTPNATPLETSNVPESLGLEESASAVELNDFAASTLVDPTSTPMAGDFDLSGIGGSDDDFAANFGAANFGATDDFSTFGAGLGASGEGSDAATIYGLIYPSLEEMAGEVRRSLEFHLGRYPDASISRLVLIGGGARLRNLDAFLTQTLGVPTTVANPFAHIQVQTPKLAPGYANENGPLCAVALGLALRDFVD